MVELRMDPISWLRKQLETADVDLLREMVRAFAETLMSAEAEALCGAAYGERGEDRVNRRNGYRDRDFDCRAGTVELRVPKLRQGSVTTRTGCLNAASGPSGRLWPSSASAMCAASRPGAWTAW